MKRLLLPLLLSLPAVSCRAVGGSGYSAVDTASGERVQLEAMADALAHMDVVFLGEEHDNDVGHELQLRLTELLLERRGRVVISLEQFERDSQHVLDLYLAGSIDEAELLERARPWPNYAEHYRPVIELAKAEGLRVVAGNVYRPLAARVSGQGRWSVTGDAYAAQRVSAGEGRYRAKFVTAMGDHAQQLGAKLDSFFEAQCLKDDTMAESMARVFEDAGHERPLIVHWCGRFHSDSGLGTVERLQDRVPGLRVGIVTMISGGSRGRDLTDEERDLADYVWLVPSMD